MKILSIILATMISLNTASAAFVEGLEDFPIPDGLEQIENAGLNFGNESIRLVEIYMESHSLKFAEIVHFYKDTLPQLGWKLVKKYSDRIVFEREGEVAEIKKESTNPLIVSLSLKSKK